MHHRVQSHDHRRFVPATVSALSALSALGAGVLAAAVPAPAGAARAVPPTPDPGSFVEVIDNPYLPLPVGAHWRYEGEADGEVEVIEVTVTGERRTVMGVAAFVVRDTVTIGGELVEDTYDWFAQDTAGNVWYLGEEVRDYEDGRVVGTAGSWEAGVGGARPGIVMPAVAVPGDVFHQELLPGEAEDMMEVIDVGATLTVTAGTFADVVVTRDWNPLEPGTIEEKAYARGVGLIREVTTAGGHGHAELVEYDLG